MQGGGCRTDLLFKGSLPPWQLSLAIGHSVQSRTSSVFQHAPALGLCMCVTFPAALC